MKINKIRSKLHFLKKKLQYCVCVVCFTWLPNGSRSEETVKHPTQTQIESFLS